MADTKTNVVFVPYTWDADSFHGEWNGVRCTVIAGFLVFVGVYTPEDGSSAHVDAIVHDVWVSGKRGPSVDIDEIDTADDGPNNRALAAEAKAISAYKAQFGPGGA